MSAIFVLGGWKDNKSPNLGHRRPRKISSHHLSLLQRSSGRPLGVRHSQTPNLRECRAVVERTEGPCRPKHCHHASGQQVWLEALARRADRRSESLCREERPVLHWDFRLGLDECRNCVPEHSHRSARRHPLAAFDSLTWLVAQLISYSCALNFQTLYNHFSY